MAVKVLATFLLTAVVFAHAQDCSCDDTEAENKALWKFFEDLQTLKMDNEEAQTAVVIPGMLSPLICDCSENNRKKRRTFPEDRDTQEPVPSPVKKDYSPEESPVKKDYSPEESEVSPVEVTEKPEETKVEVFDEYADEVPFVHSRSCPQGYVRIAFRCINEFQLLEMKK